MLPHARRFGCGLGALGTLLVVHSFLGLASPAAAGQGEGNLQPAGRLLLELDANTSRFRLDDGDAATADRIQLIRDRKVDRAKDACLVGLTPDGSDPTHPNALVSLPGAPGSTDWGIDTGKLALGGRGGKGTACGQLDFGEIARLEVDSLFLTDARLQIEAKQDAAARLTLKLDDGSTERQVGTRYLLSGRAVLNPPAEVVSACAPRPVTDCAPLARAVLERTDGGPDSGNNDDGFWEFTAPFHNVEVFEILTNSDGTQGKLSLKGGGEYPDPANNRSSWLAFEVDGFLACGDTLSNDAGTVTGNRTNAGACTALIPFDLDFDGQEVRFDTLDTANQGSAFALQVHFSSEAAQHPIPRTVLSYDADGVDCTGVDPEGPGPFTASCIGLTVCEGTPIRRCGDGSGCREDADCTDGSSCRLADLLPPAGGFPDLVPTSTTPEYGCICEEDVLYLGPGACADGSSCSVDAECADGSACEPFPAGDAIAVEQCIFFLGDPIMKRGGGGI